MSRLLVWLSLALLVAAATAQGPTRCGNGWSCISGQAECQGGSCVCGSQFAKGNGAFACYRNNQVAAEVKNDPHLSNFDNETLAFPFPCRYLITHASSQLKDSGRNVIGSCEFEVYGYNAKTTDRGKFFTHGFDVAITLVYSDGTAQQFSSRNYGTASNGVYSFTRQGTVGEYNPNGPFGNDAIDFDDDANGVKVAVSIDDANNQLLFEARQCGLAITFVPFDVADPYNQVSLPGVSVALNTGYDPSFMRIDQAIALEPGLPFSTIVQNGLDESQSVLAYAFTRDVDQSKPYDDNGQCAAIGSEMTSCRDNDRRKAIRNCEFLLREPRFIRCYDKTRSAQRILNLFKKCVQMWCGDLACSEIQGDIIDAECDDVRDIRDLERLIDGTNCR